jgi:predicted dehydrogenase
MNKTALIGNGYWGSKIEKYIPEFFDLKYITNSKFDKNIIWDDDDVKSVIVATPIETHYEIVKEALLNNKHVFCEKPITLRSSQAEELKEISQQRKLQIGVNYVQTFSSSIKESLNWVDKIGGIKYIEMSTKHLGRFMDFDVYWLLASHHLSILDMFIDLNTLSFKFEDNLFRNGLCTTGSIVFDCGRIDVSTNFPGKEMLINIYGDNGTIKYRPLENLLTVTIYKKEQGLLPEDLTIKDISINFDENHNLRKAIKYFRNLINGTENSNLEHSLKITRILEDR